MGFGFDSSTKKYKVVRIFLRSFDRDTGDQDLGCEVFILGDDSWREIDCPPCLSYCLVTVGEVIYWLTYKKEHGIAILRLVLETRRLGWFQLLPSRQMRTMPLLVALEGDLGYVDCRFGSYLVDIWVLNACNNTWSKKYNIDCSNLRHMKPEAMHDGKVLFSSSNRLAYFDPRSKTSGAVLAIGGAPNDDKYSWKLVVPYAESLVSVMTG